MTSIREPGKVNDTTTMIDIGLFGAAGVGSIYLVEAGKSCLIDCGTQAEAPFIIKTLRDMDAFPPDIVVFTHSHYDHCQGISIIRKEAAKLEKHIDVMASMEAIPLLEDQSYNKAFDPKGTYENILDVKPFAEGDIIDLEGTTLRVFTVPGHNRDHIALLDEMTKNLFIGDSIGYKVADGTFIPPFMPPYWDEQAFRSSIDKIRQIDYESLSLGHFGYIYSDEAKEILDEAVLAHETWWNVFKEADNSGKLDDIDYITESILNETGVIVPDFRLVSTKLKVGLKVLNGVRKLQGKKPLAVADVLLHKVATWLINGYRIATGKPI
jgi:glyoxylase-like metal-dependent hydrolase (beta-lactamase superfamily II)